MEHTLESMMPPKRRPDWKALFLGPRGHSRRWPLGLLLLALYGWFQLEHSPSEFQGPRPRGFFPRQGGFSFMGVAPKSRSVDLTRFRELSYGEAQNAILNSLPASFRPRLAPHLPTLLHFAEKFRIDPFWAISIMWTESHFDNDAISRANARGLMQVMPDTALYIGRMLKKNMERKVLLSYAKTPYGNMEFGIFYLSFLLKKFQGNHTLATVAYNMGPYWVSRRIRLGLPVGTKNLYLEKVNRAYRRISRGHRNWPSGPQGRTPTALALHGMPRDVGFGFL